MTTSQKGSGEEAPEEAEVLGLTGVAVATQASFTSTIVPLSRLNPGQSEPVRQRLVYDTCAVCSCSGMNRKQRRSRKPHLHPFSEHQNAPGGKYSPHKSQTSQRKVPIAQINVQTVRKQNICSLSGAGHQVSQLCDTPKLPGWLLEDRLPLQTSTKVTVLVIAGQQYATFK